MHQKDSEPRHLELNCFVLGDDPGRVFSIRIAATDSVITLRKLIKDEQKPAFDHVPAHTLVLWSVSILVDENLRESLSKLELVDKGSLQPVQELSEIFTGTLAKKRVHIVIKAPPSGECVWLTVSRLYTSAPDYAVSPLSVIYPCTTPVDSLTGLY